jgi:hypothetical protein
LNADGADQANESESEFLELHRFDDLIPKIQTRINLSGQPDPRSKRPFWHLLALYFWLGTSGLRFVNFHSPFSFTKTTLIPFGYPFERISAMALSPLICSFLASQRSFVT